MHIEKINLSQDLSVSRIVHGHMRLIDWNMINNEILKLTRQVIDLVITRIDQADIYGDFSCEEKFGEILRLDKSLRSKIVTKCCIKFPDLNRPQYKSHIYDTSSRHISCFKSNKSATTSGSSYLKVVLYVIDSAIVSPTLGSYSPLINNVSLLKFFHEKSLFFNNINFFNSYVSFYKIYDIAIYIHTIASSVVVFIYFKYN